MKALQLRFQKLLQRQAKRENKKMRLLIVGLIQGQLSAAARIAIDRGVNVTNAESVAQAVAVMRLRGADLIMMDITLPIRELTAALERDRIRTPVIACGIDTTPQAAADAIRAGAKEFIPLPPDPELIAAVLGAVANEKQSIVWRDPAMEKIVQMAETFAKSDASILITGESGTGKEVIARHIHERSRRASKPFVSVNCAAIPDALLESELFGHEKGAFTGASGRRIGKFEEADGGTLLLDEISEMEPRLQAKLLRALQERVIDRVGGAKPVSVNIRVLATSNRSLSEEVAKGTFREDLFYRLNVVNLKVPPLRDRPQDILALAGFFVEKYSTLNQIAVLKLTADAKRLLLSARWKGNVRELENAIHRAVLLASGDEIGTDEIVIDQTSSFNAPMDQASRAAQTAESLTRSLVGKSVSEVEQHLILDTLDHCLGNRTHAAKILGISIRTLRNKLNEYVASGLALPDMQR